MMMHLLQTWLLLACGSFAARPLAASAPAMQRLQLVCLPPPGPKVAPVQRDVRCPAAVTSARMKPSMVTGVQCRERQRDVTRQSTRGRGSWTVVCTSVGMKPGMVTGVQCHGETETRITL
jgi:hypothetical protein